jgi:hypothetical protein
MSLRKSSGLKNLLSRPKKVRKNHSFILFSMTDVLILHYIKIKNVPAFAPIRKNTVEK